MTINAKTKICMVIGDPIEHSLSPQMHNAGYHALGIDHKFLFVACKVKSKHLSDFIKGARVMGIKGISCTIPHKVEVVKYLDKIDKKAETIGAVNTIVNEKGELVGYNTDWQGVVTPLSKIISLKRKTVALLGAGGAARAVAYGVVREGAKLAVFNRTFKKGQKLAEEFGGRAYQVEDLHKAADMDIIFNATPLGMKPNEDKSPIRSEFISKKHIVFDAVYKPQKTRLLREAKKRGARVIYGAEMLLYQGTEQFKLYTGHDAPEKVMREVLHL